MFFSMSQTCLLCLGELISELENPSDGRYLVCNDELSIHQTWWFLKIVLRIQIPESWQSRPTSLTGILQVMDMLCHLFRRLNFMLITTITRAIVYIVLIFHPRKPRSLLSVTQSLTIRRLVDIVNLWKDLSNENALDISFLIRNLLFWYTQHLTSLSFTGELSYAMNISPINFCRAPIR